MSILKVDYPEENVAVVTWNTNDKNTMILPFCDELEVLIKELENNQKIIFVCFQGGDGFFSNGFDPNEFYGKSEEYIRDVISRSFGLCLKIFKANFIAVALINGHCMGYGAIFSIFCDYRVIQDSKARFSFPEILIGLSLPHFVSIRLQQFLSFSVIRNLANTGKALKPQEALELGLMDYICGSSELKEVTLKKIIYPLLKHSWSGILYNKQSLNSSFYSIIQKAYEDDVKFSPKLILTENAQKGMEALIKAKRPVVINKTKPVLF